MILSKQKIFRILVLEDRGLRGEIEESIVKLERRHRPFDQLSKTFYRSHNSKGFQDLKKAIEIGHLSKDTKAKTQPAKESNNAKTAATNRCSAQKSWRPIYEKMTVIVIANNLYRAHS